MRIVSAKFIGLKGIYSKSGIDEVNIDFTQCKHNIVMIVGKNGSGKSTLLNVLTPLPDSPQMYLDHRLGSKEIVYTDGENVYEINILYPVSSNGTRMATKAFFKETKNGQTVELNPNGTLGSYKDILFNKFNLDANYISLSKLSMEDRGIVDKRPSERKKYVGKMLESVEAYNDIYKTLVKRSSIFKSMINSITAKIDSIGDEQKLTMEINAINTRIASLESEKKVLESSISGSNATIAVYDPNNSIQDTYNKCIEELKNLQLEKENIELSISALSSKFDIDLTFENITKKHKLFENLKAATNQEIELTKQKLQYTLANREEDAMQIEIKRQKLLAQQSDTNIGDLKNSIVEYRKKIFEYEKIFKTIGVENFEISKDEYILGLNTLNDLRNTVLNIKSYADNTQIIEMCNYICGGINPAEELAKLNTSLEETKTTLSEYEKELNYHIGQLSKLDILGSRPSNCNIDTCPFIKDAVEAAYGNPQENVDKLSELIDGAREVKRQLELSIERTILNNKIYNDLQNTIRAIKNNSGILNKLPNGNIFSDISSFLDRVKNGDQFNDIYDLYQYIDYANIFELYKNDNKILVDLEAQYKIYESKIDTIDDLNNEILELNEKIKSIDKEIDTTNNLILEKQKELVDIDKMISTCDILLERFDRKKTIDNSIKDTEMRLATVSDSIKTISRELEKISNDNNRLITVNKELEPLQNDRDRLRFSLNKLDEYNQELKVYTAKFNMIQMIKKYSSPTEGIQTVFMKLYMDSTLSMANKLLSLLFNGQLELMSYEINESEFRIPCRNNITSIINDDISSCSSAEKSMISMILSFILSYQSSPIFNIPTIDEMDEMLDANNRATYPQFLNQVMEILGIDMCIMVSHSPEMDRSDVDIIQLLPATAEVPKGNIIYSLV